MLWFCRLYQVINHFYLSYPQNFLNRTILAFCCVCSRVPGGIKFFVESALSLIDLQLYPVVSQRAFLGLDMLTIAPVEVEELDVSPNLRLTLQEQLLEAVPMVLAVVRAGSSLLLQTQQQQTHHNAATDTAQHSAAGVVPVAVHADENQLRDCVLRLTKSWLRQGITMSKVFDEQQPLVNVLWFGMQSGDQAAIVQGSELVADLVDIDEFPRPGSRDAAVVAIMQLLVATASTATLVAAMNDAAKGTHEAIDSSNDAVVHALCSCAIAVATKETALVAGPTHCNADFFRFLIFCSGRQRKLATLAFDTWLAIQDMPVASRHPFAQQEVYFHVLESLFALCMYPEGFHSWADCDDTDEDDFKAFRDHRQGIQEVLLACFDALQTPFFDFCREKLLRVGLFVTAADGSRLLCPTGIAYFPPPFPAILQHHCHHRRCHRGTCWKRFSLSFMPAWKGYIATCKHRIAWLEQRRRFCHNSNSSFSKLHTELLG